MNTSTTVDALDSTDSVIVWDPEPPEGYEKQIVLRLDHWDADGEVHILQVALSTEAAAAVAWALLDRSVTP